MSSTWTRMCYSAQPADCWDLLGTQTLVSVLVALGHRQLGSKVGSRHTVEYYSALKKNEVLPFETVN